MPQQKPINRRGLGSIFKDCTHDWKRCKEHPWKIRYYDASGKQREETSNSATATTPAWERLEEIRTAKRTGNVSKAAPATMTFGTYADMWLTRRRKIQDRSIKHYAMVLRLHLKPAVGEAKKLASIRRQTVFDAVATLEDAISPSYLRDAFWSVLVPILRSAALDGYMEQLDLRDVELPEIVKRERTLPTPEEVHHLYDSVQPIHQFAIVLMAGCGLRIGETMAVDEACFIDEEFLRVRQQWREDSTMGPLKHRKTGQFRDTPLAPRVLGAKEVHLGLSEFKRAKNPNGFLFPSFRKPGKPRGGHPLQREITKIVRDDGLTEGITAHTLRHYFATHAVQLDGVDITDVARWLGHRNIQLTYEIYGHLLPSSHAKARTQIDRVLPMAA